MIGNEIFSFIYNHDKKYIPKNKNNIRCPSTKAHKTCWEKFKKTYINGEIYHIYELENLITLQFSSN